MTTLTGVQFFPVTPFDREGGLALEVLAQHVERGLAAGPGAVFAACGTGEFHALSPSECRQVAQVTVSEVAGQVPVFAGTGGSLGGAIEIAQNAQRAGVDGLLVLPPYLVAGSQHGLVKYVQRIADATDLQLIVYNRKESRLDPDSVGEMAEIHNVVGFKDGLGDMDQMSQIMVEVKSRLTGVDKQFQFFNGLPTAETSAVAYRRAGIEIYSSAAFAFIPDISLAFYAAICSDDDDTVATLVANFFVPFARLRSLLPGGAVSLVKAGVTLSGLNVGSVRPPLLDPSSTQVARLQQIIEAGRAAID